VIAKEAVERERDVILREYEEVQKMKDEVVFDELHKIAFQVGRGERSESRT